MTPKRCLFTIAITVILGTTLFAQGIELPGSNPQKNKTEEEKAREEVQKAQEELEKAKAKLERIEKARTNRENNKKLLESLEKKRMEADKKGDRFLSEAYRRLHEEISRRMNQNPSQDSDKLLKDALAEIEKRHGRLPRKVKDQLHSDVAKTTGIETPKATATGRTTGRIGNMDLHNTSSEPMTFSFPVMEIPSDGTHQGYIVMSSPPVTLTPGATAQIPLFGFCTDVHRPPVPDGESFPLFETWLVNTPLVETWYQVTETLETVQHSGTYNTPLSDDPEKEKTVVVQHVIWLTGSPLGLYTFEDICYDIMRQVEIITGSPVASLSSIEYATFRSGLDELIRMMNDVGVQSGIPSFLPSIETSGIPTPGSTTPTADPGFGRMITAKGTGRTTGHIATLTLTNPTRNSSTVQVGSGMGLYIPSSGPYQPYLVPELAPITLGPGETKEVPLQGFCVDIRKPPVPEGGGMPPLSDWYSVPLPTGTEVPAGTVVIPTRATYTPGLAGNIMVNSRPLLWSALDEDCLPAPKQITSLIPGTGRPLPGDGDGLFASGRQPEVAVPVMLDAIQRITHTYDELKSAGGISTPFSNNPEKERESVVQNTFWIYAAALEGKTFQKEDFQVTTERQFEQSTGKKKETLPVEQQEKLDVGVDDFWNTFTTVGVEAKILDVPPVVPSQPEPFPRDIWEDYDVGYTKNAAVRDSPTPEIPFPANDVLISHQVGDPKCICGKISFTLTNYKFRAQINSEKNKWEIELEDLEAVAGEYDTALIKAKGPAIFIEDIEVSCDCSTSGKCNFYPRNSQYAESDEGKVRFTSSTHFVSDFPTNHVRNKVPGYNAPLKLKVHAWCKGDSCAETRDCMETFTITFKKK